MSLQRTSGPAALAIAVAALASACGGGGPVDPGFYGEITPAAADAPVPRPRDPEARQDAEFQRPKLVLIRAAWCAICKAAEPVIESTFEPYRPRMDLVVLDVTDDAAIARAADLAEREGVRRFFDQYQGRIPTAGVFVGPDDGRLVHGSLEDPLDLERELQHALDLRRSR